jgi:hypothetical protein
MANTKISALTSATTPLAGTEVLPIVQSSATTKVTIANVTEGRAVSMLRATSAGANTYNVINNTGAPGTNASPSFAGTQFLGSAARLIAQTDGGDCSSSSLRGVYRIRTCDDGGTDMNTRMQFDGSASATLYTVNFSIGTANKGIEFAGNGGVLWRCGAGTPEGAVTALVGSLYTRSDGGLLSTLYVKESGTGNTGWIAK